MATTVRQWTGLEAKALRAALRMTMRDFADYLGVGTRTVAKWEARGSDIQPMPQAQAILDTALAKGSSDVQARFAAAVSHSLAGRATVVDASSAPGKHSGEAVAPTPSSVPILQSRVLLPVVVDGRHVLLPLDAARCRRWRPGIGRAPGPITWRPLPA